MSPTALAVTSVGSSPAAVVPVLAALEAVGVSLRAIDVGRLGSSSEATMDRVLKAVTGELSERRLAREWAQNPPDVALAFDPGSAEALVALGRGAVRPAPVVCVVPELSPRPEWGRVDAERFLAIDDRAAAELGECGVPDDRVIVVGPMVEARFAGLAKAKRSDVRKKFKIGAKELVVLVDVAGFGYERAAQVALQLALVEDDVLFLFDAGDDSEAASALRAQVPTLDMRAKLFGVTEDEPVLWRTADVVVAPPSPLALSRALSVGARMVCLVEGDASSAQAFEDRGRGKQAGSPLFISSALEPLLAAAKKRTYRSGKDGAGNVADVVFAVGEARTRIVEENQSRGRESTSQRVGEVTAAYEAGERARRTPGDLEDLSGGADAQGGSEPPSVDPREIERLMHKLDVQKERLEKTIADANKSAAEWDRRRAAADKDGGGDAARHAERNADLERARMHNALADLANVEAERQRLEKAKEAPPPRPPPRRRAQAEKSGGGTSVHNEPSVDDLLSEMKKNSTGSSGTKRRRASKKKKRRKSTVDDELAALKNKMKKGSRK